MDIKGGTGNCAALDNTNILFVTKANTNAPPINSVDDMSIIKKYNLDVPDLIQLEEEIISFVQDISLISENVVTYIAGFVVKKLKKNTLCITCKFSLEQNYASVDDTNFKLLNQKNRGGLLRPSSDVIQICILVEKRIRQIMYLNNKQMTKENIFYNVFVNEISSNIVQNNFFYSY